MALTITQKLIPTSRYNWKSHTTMNPIGICIHNTANEASAVNEIAYMTRIDQKISYHYAVDDTQAIQALPENRTAWHAGDN
jgi:N-acetylmuramoyl-L-alanine amidase CwlA